MWTRQWRQVTSDGGEQTQFVDAGTKQIKGNMQLLCMRMSHGHCLCTAAKCTPTAAGAGPGPALAT